MKMRMLITGGSGFIGKNLVEFLLKRYEVLAPTSRELNLLDSHAVYSYLQKNKCDQVIHCSTHNATITSDKDRSLIFQNNVRMFMNLARVRNLYNRMFYFGSGAEYARDRMPPKVKEEFFDLFVPEDDYGFSKYIMAKYAEGTDNIYDLRLFGCFGPHEDWRIRFISNAICRALFRKKITLSQDAVFDYLYVKDLGRIMVRFLQRKTLQYKHYNICTGETVHLKQLAQLVKKILDSNVRISVARKGLQREYSGDNSRLMKEMGGFQFTPIARAVEELIEWYRKNKILIDSDQFAR